MRWLLLVLCFPLTSIGYCEDSKLNPIWPKLPTAVVQEPIPKPPIDPNAIQTISVETFYVVSSEVEFCLLVSPPKLARVTYLQGPVTLRGKFTDGAGEVETRIYTDKFIAIPDVISGSVGDAELIYIPHEVKSEAAISRRMVKIGYGPRPPPEPTPVIVQPGFRVLFIYEVNAKKTREFENILHSPEITEFLSANCVKDPTGTLPEWRKWDQNIIVNPNESPTIRALWDSVKPLIGDAATSPKLVVAVNGDAKVYPFPATAQETLTFLKMKLEGK